LNYEKIKKKKNKKKKRKKKKKKKGNNNSYCNKRNDNIKTIIHNNFMNETKTNQKLKN